MLLTKKHEFSVNVDPIHVFGSPLDNFAHGRPFSTSDNENAQARVMMIARLRDGC
jgi:hypothetical protein